MEAWLAGRPCVYSLPFEAQVGDAAICVDPDSAADLASAVKACLDPATRADLIERGRARLEEIDRARGRGGADLLRRLRQFKVRR
jgi:hypothetical protein